MELSSKVEAFALFGWSAAAAHTGSHTSGQEEEVRQLPISERRRGSSDVEREAKPATARSAAAPAIASGACLRTRLRDRKEEPPLCSITTGEYGPPSDGREPRLEIGEELGAAGG